MAAKIIPMKHNPVSLHSAKTFNLSGQNDFKPNMEKHHDTKPPKDNTFNMKGYEFYNGDNLMAKNGGKFLSF